jgi:hypothetical protein
MVVLDDRLMRRIHAVGVLLALTAATVAHHFGRGWLANLLRKRGGHWLALRRFREVHALV